LKYKPQPIDTSAILLPSEVLELSEQLARNTHENWSRQRLLDGWRYGPERNDQRKEHPGLVPYDELSESEKQYDRNTALEALKAIVSLGYTLNPPEPAPAGADTGIEPEKQHDHTHASVWDLQNLDLKELFTLWQAHNPEDWAGNVDSYVTLGKHVLRSGEPLLAYDVVTEGLRQSPSNVRLRQLQALGLARSGITGRANEILKQLYDEGNRDEETLGILARTHKDLWERAQDRAERQHHLLKAHEYYSEAYELTGGYWTGINAATTAMLLGQADRATALAKQVRAECLIDLEKCRAGNGDTYWPVATLGEAALVLNEWDEADRWYKEASRVGSRRFGELNSTRRNARLIVEAMGGDRQWIERNFTIPSVVVFTGHMIDRPDRAEPRFPPAIEPEVRVALRSKLEELNAGIGFSSAACGGDIIFLETILELGGEAHIVLPYNQNQFLEDSVEITGDGEWKSRFERVLQLATEVLVASEQRMEGGIPFEYANLLLHGMARMRANQLETRLQPLALWDQNHGDALGGTAQTVGQWRARGDEVSVVDINKILKAQQRAGSPRLTPTATPGPEQSTEFPTRMISILFADAVSFSKLTEDEIPRFLKFFLGSIGRLAANSEFAPIYKNTWGDGLYFVFDNVRDAGNFGLELAELLRSINWADHGLPPSLNLRIALHAGPAYSCIDPVTNTPNFIGRHVSRAARMEPITPPGHVYSSQAFAALASSLGVKEFRCEYVGQTPLAKGYGTFPTYHVRPATAS
jgi:class 3 adenylate cyclase